MYSVCSAHALVIEAALRYARATGQSTLIEATSNQVNQYGGYTGMKPADFVRSVRQLGAHVGFSDDALMFGGDHLGPNCWQDLDAEAAMIRADALIADYVAAGFRKIHLDCSMSCADDPKVLSDVVVAARAARLCAVAERTWRTVGGEAPVYVIGTEVPVPGGAHETLVDLAITDPKAAAATIAEHESAFESAALIEAWPRVVGSNQG